MSNIQLLKGDCLKLLADIPDKSIDLVLTDPPYEHTNGGKGKSELAHRATKLKQDIDFMSHSFDMDNVFSELMRVCKIPNMLIFCSNRQIEPILHWFSDKPNLTTAVLVWVKTNPIPSTNGNHLSDIEYCIYVHGKGATFNNECPFDYKRKAYVSGLVSADRFHPAQKPDELIKRYVSLHSNEGDTVLDCFMGSGSTGVWCKKLNRNFIGMEITDKYFDIATNRINGAHKVKALF